MGKTEFVIFEWNAAKATRNCTKPTFHSMKEQPFSWIPWPGRSMIPLTPATNGGEAGRKGGSEDAPVAGVVVFQRRVGEVVQVGWEGD